MPTLRSVLEAKVFACLARRVQSDQAFGADQVPLKCEEVELDEETEGRRVVEERMTAALVR
jgi:hypothetical protein